MHFVPQNDQHVQRKGKKERFSPLSPLCVGDPRGCLGPECLGGVGRSQSSGGAWFLLEAWAWGYAFWQGSSSEVTQKQVLRLGKMSPVSLGGVEGMGVRAAEAHLAEGSGGSCTRGQSGHPGFDGCLSRLGLPLPGVGASRAWWEPGHGPRCLSRSLVWSQVLPRFVARVGFADVHTGLPGSPGSHSTFAGRDVGNIC